MAGESPIGHRTLPTRAQVMGRNTSKVRNALPPYRGGATIQGLPEKYQNLVFKKNGVVGEVQSIHFSTPLPCGEDKDESCGQTDRWCPKRGGQARWVSEKGKLWCHGLKGFFRSRSAIMWIRLDHDLGLGFMGMAVPMSLLE